MSPSRTLFAVSLILVLSFALRIWNLAEVPGGFSPEEITGIRVIETIRGGTIYVFFDVGQEHGVESLYYALAVTVTRLLGDGLLGYRALALWLGMLSVATMFTVARRLFGRDVGLIACFAMGVSLYPVMLSRTATHHVLLPLLLLCVLWAVSEAYTLDVRHRPHMSVTVAFSLLGLSVALIAYAHPTGIFASLGVAFFAFHYGRNVPKRFWRDVLWNSGYALLIAFILGIPFLISILRNWEISSPAMFIAEGPASPVGLAESIAATLLAFLVRGDTNPAHHVPGLPILQLIEPALFIMGLGFAIRRRQEPNYALVLIFWVLGVLPDMWTRGNADYRLLEFALPATYLLIGVGAAEAVRFIRHQTDLPLAYINARQLSQLALWIIIGGLLFNVYQTRQNLMEWGEREDTQFTFRSELGKVARYLDSNPDTAAQTLVCMTDFESQPVDDFRRAVSDEQILEWMLHKENLHYRVAQCRSDLVLINGGDPMQIVFSDPIDTNISSPLLSWLRLAHPVDEDGLMVWKLNAKTNIQAKLSEFSIYQDTFYPRDPNTSIEVAPLPLHFQGNLSFIGFEPLPRITYRAGDILTLTTYWRVNAPPPIDIGIFLRLNDIPQASPYAETNGFGVDAERLQAGDIIIQVGFLSLPLQLRPHQYLITTGVYRQLPVNQMAVFDAVTGLPRGIYLILDQPFQVQSP